MITRVRSGLARNFFLIPIDNFAELRHTRDMGTDKGNEMSAYDTPSRRRLANLTARYVHVNYCPECGSENVVTEDEGDGLTNYICSDCGSEGLL